MCVDQPACGRLWGARQRAGLLVAACLALGAGQLHAHDPFEITADARLRDDTLELVVTMARSTALSVAAGGRESPTFDPAQFEKLRPKFEACAPSLFELTAAGRKLALKRVTLALTIENDVEFRLVYAAPRRPPLRLRATHVTKLPYGYGVVLAVHSARDELGRDLLVAGSPELVLERLEPATVARAAP